MLNKNYKNISEDISSWISKTVKDAGFSKVIIALSGGVDSAVSASLSVKGLGSKNVYCILLPYGDLSHEHTEDAKLVTNHLQVPNENIHLINIKQSVDIIQNASGIPMHRVQSKFNPIRLGNIMARVRMIYLYDLAKKLNVLVCGTENKTEHLLGYFTRFGDEASDLEPIRNLYKTQVWELAKKLKIPEKIINKAPTAGLWESQTDEGEFGFSYNDADKILSLFIEEKLDKDTIVNKGFGVEVVEKVLDRMKKNAYKHKLPYTFK